MKPIGRKLAQGRDSEIFEHGPKRVLRLARDGRSLVAEAEHRQRALEALRDLDRQAAAAARGSVTELLVQGAALHLQAELRWLDLCDLRLRDPGSTLLPSTNRPFPNPKEPS